MALQPPLLKSVIKIRLIMKLEFDDYYTVPNFANHHKDVNRMGNYTKIKLLFLSMIVFLMSFTSKDKENDLPADVVTYINTGTINYFTFLSLFAQLCFKLRLSIIPKHL